MSEPERKTQESEGGQEADQENKGPNLILLYSLLALALIAAITFAALVVWPFHTRR
jgi:hypothetical protein